MNLKEAEQIIREVIREVENAGIDVATTDNNSLYLTRWENGRIVEWGDLYL